MTSDVQNNKEQLEMLRMTLTEVPYGICLFQSRNQAEWVSLIQKMLGEDKVITHNIADDNEKQGMINSQDFRKWASESDATIIIVYNIQLLGLRFGDEETVEQLNFMRDQILAIGKMFVLGVSPYFNQLLSRKARDLYSCILYHFVFQDSIERIIEIPYLNIENLSGDDVLEMKKYKDIKQIIKNNQGKNEISTYLTCIKSWHIIREYLSYQENKFITTIAKTVDEQYTYKKIKLSDIENIWTLAETWIILDNAKRSSYWYKKVLSFVEEQLGNEHEIYADALIQYVNYYKAINNYTICENFCNQAINIYQKKGMEASTNNKSALHQKAIICRIQSKFNEALKIYETLLEYSISKYGEKYYDNAYLYNNIGRVYEEQEYLSNALQYYKKALEILNITGKQGLLIAAIYQNICVVYLKTGDGREAWKYIKKAKKITETIYGKNSSHLINIYNNMSGVWDIRKQPDKEFDYLQKAITLIKENDMDDSEDAAYIYYNMGKLLCKIGIVDDAIFYCKHAISIREKVYGEKNELTAKTYELLGFIFYYVSNPIEAKKNIDKAKNIYISLYGNKCKHIEKIDKIYLYIDDLKLNI